jgi:O-antigen/teichoic acid export membrane protein
MVTGSGTTSRRAPAPWSLLVRTSASVVVRVIGAAASFALTAVTARVLGSGGAGAFYLATTIALVVSVVARVGLDTVTLRFVAAHDRDDRGDLALGVLRHNLLVVAGVATGLAGVLLAAAPVIATRVLGDTALVGPLRWAAVAVVPLALLGVVAQALFAVGHAAVATFVQNGAVPVGALAALAAAALAGRASATGLVAGYAIAAAAAVLVGRAAWRRTRMRRRWPAPGPVDRGLLLRTGAPLLVVAAVAEAMRWTDTLVLGAFATTSEVGEYGAALRTAAVPSFFVVALNSIVAPQFSRLHHGGDRAALAVLVRRTALMATLVTAPAVVVFVLAPGPVLRLLFGEPFAAAGPVLAVLAVGQLLDALTAPARHLLMMSGGQRPLQLVLVTAGTGNLALTLLLVPRFGGVGAAVAAVLSTLVLHAAQVVLARRTVGIWCLPALSLRTASAPPP